MRAPLTVIFLALLAAAPALAQTAAAPSAANPAPAAAPPAANPAPGGAVPRRGRDITRDEYLDHAKQNAERRFDAMDANHDGVLTLDERRAYHAAHRRGRSAEPPAEKQ